MTPDYQSLYDKALEILRLHERVSPRGFQFVLQMCERLAFNRYISDKQVQYLEDLYCQVADPRPERLASTRRDDDSPLQ